MNDDRNNSTDIPHDQPQPVPHDPALIRDLEESLSSCPGGEDVEDVESRIHEYAPFLDRVQVYGGQADIREFHRTIERDVVGSRMAFEDFHTQLPLNDRQIEVIDALVDLGYLDFNEYAHCRVTSAAIQLIHKIAYERRGSLL